MRTHLLSVVAWCVAGLLASQAWAQATPPREGDRRARNREARAGRRQVDPEARRARAQQRLDQLVKELKLTEKQEPVVRQILTTNQQERTQWFQQNLPEMRKLQAAMRQARQDKDTDAANAAQEKLRALMQKRQETQENLRKQLKEVLTDEQMVVAQRLLLRGNRGRQAGPPFWALRRLKLTEKQNQDVQKIIREARTEAAKKAAAAAKPAAGEEPAPAERRRGRDRERMGREWMDAAWKQIVDEVLLPEQKKELDKLVAEREKQMRARRERAGGRRERAGNRPERPERRDRTRRGGRGGV
jgi:Spy/CpxP family protein refolding chaperone